MASDESQLPKSEEEIKELVEEYEGKTRKLAGRWAAAATAVAVAMALYHLYAANATFIRHLHLIRHLLFVLVLTFALYPATARSVRRQAPTAWDLLLIVLSLLALGYPWLDFDNWVNRAYIPTTWDLVFGIVTILLILEATRRSVGNALLLIVVGFLVYAYVGPWLPEPWTHKGYDTVRIVGQLYITLEGIFGVPLEVSATFIVLFTIYGAILEGSGAGRFFVDLALALVGRRRTGPGQAVTVASFLLGGPSGSGVATTVTVGTITYPMLKRAGYDRESAGGLLSAGGIGATISPPILGAAAFIIAEILKISYLQVLIMASIPTLLYYFSIMLMIEFDARRWNLQKIEIAAGDARALILRYWYLLASLVVIPIFMLIGFTAIKAVFWSIVIAAATSLLRRETALVTVRRTGVDVGRLIRSLDNGSRQVLNVGVTCAAAGIVVGVVNLTGLGLKLSDVIIAYAGGGLLPTLIFAAIALWVLGLALPITATYIIAAVIVAPALIKLGVSELAAHMFIFYYAVLSEVSPPVGLAPLAAAALTGGRPFRTMIMAWKYTLPAFVVPFMFTTHANGLGLLLQAPWPIVLEVTVIAGLGLVGLAAALTGWFVRYSTTVERVALAIAGVILIHPAGIQDLPAAAVIVAIGLVQWYTRRRFAPAQAA
ncbi:MAG: TRAP transporter fused permease subunit [Armatimonadota bacterium]|nr:TRAP transporter fused permease subunit [Armatimonadota bacterium]